jgi:hypothetical protein
MTKTQTAPISGFTPGERAYIRNELDIFFSTLPSVAEGFQLRLWRGGPEAGQPKLSPVAKGLLERGLMRLDTSGRGPCGVSQGHGGHAAARRVQHLV